MPKISAGEGGREVSLSQEWPFLLGLALMGLVIFFYRLGVPGLMDPDEGRYAEIAREIIVLKDWLVPHLNFLPYLEKPPLVYWLTALSFKALGYTELAARLPSGLSAVGGLFLAYWLGRTLWGPASGFLGATVLATCCGYVALGRILTLDMTFSLLLSLAIGLGYLALSRDRSRLWPWAYGVLALAVLTKGPVAFILAGLIWGLWVLSQRRPWGSLLQPWSWLLLAVLVLPWFIYVQWRLPDFFRYFILEQHFGRFLTPAIHPEPLYYYLPVLLGLLLPWSWLLPWVLWRRGEKPNPDRAFLLIWAGVVVVFFSLSRGKLAPYILAALPPLALLVGKRLHEIVIPREVWRKNIGLIISLWSWCTVGLFLLLVLYGATPASLSKALGRANLTQSYALLVVAVFTLTPLCTLAGRRWGLLFLGAGALVLSTLLPVGLERLSQQRSPRELGRIVHARWQPGDALVGVYLYSQGLSFYSREIFHLIESKTELDFGRKLAPARERQLYFANEGKVAEFARSRPRVFFYVKPDVLEVLQRELPGKFQLLARQGDCLLLTYERE